MAGQRATSLTILIAALAVLPATAARADAVTATASASVTILDPAPRTTPRGSPGTTGPAGPTSSTTFAVVGGALRVTVSYN